MGMSCQGAELLVGKNALKGLEIFVMECSFGIEKSDGEVNAVFEFADSDDGVSGEG